MQHLRVRRCLQQCVLEFELLTLEQRHLQWENKLCNCDKWSMRKPSNRMDVQSCVHASMAGESLTNKATENGQGLSRGLFHGHDIHAHSLCASANPHSHAYKHCSKYWEYWVTPRSVGANSIAGGGEENRKRGASMLSDLLINSLTLSLARSLWCLFIGIKLFLPPPPRDHEQINL